MAKKRANLRIPFEAAISDELLLKGMWEELSLHQMAILKVIYGLPLDPNHTDDLGWSELDYWKCGQGFCEYDDLGYISRILPVPFEYIPKRYSEAWLILGRRSGKSGAIMALIVAYESTCGGHEAYIRSGQEILCLQIAQDLKLAKNTLGFIQANLESSKVLAKLIKNKTAEHIELNNGITIATVPPSLKSVRGYGNPCAVMDEVGVWYQDAESANPDYEIYRALSPGQAQFPDSIIVGISSPWNKAGMLYGYMEAGTEGRNAPESEKDRYANCLVWHSPTAAMGNPLITKPWLIKERDKDPRAFERECLAIFQDSISGFLSPTLLREAVEKGCYERPPAATFRYVAAMDPAFRRDAFGFAICHAEKDKGIVFDVLRRWEGSPDQPINPREVLAEIAALLSDYKFATVYTDQYHLESLQQLALDYGFALEGVPFTNVSKAGIYGSLQQLVNQKRIHLLDEQISLRELRSLEKKMLSGGAIQIGAPAGQHDDLATVIALSTDKAIWMLPQPAKEKPKEPTIHEQIIRQLKRQRAEEYANDDWY